MDPVSYTHLDVYKRQVPVGYGDGYFRALSNRAEVVIRERRYPVVGNVCMDQLMVNIEWQTAYNGDEVILLGEAEGGAAVTVEELAEWAGTVPWEILTNINTRVPVSYTHLDVYKRQPWARSRRRTGGRRSASPRPRRAVRRAPWAKRVRRSGP